MPISKSIYNYIGAPFFKQFRLNGLDQGLDSGNFVVMELEPVPFCYLVQFHNH